MTAEAACDEYGEPILPHRTTRMRVVAVPGGRYGLVFDRVCDDLVRFGTLRKPDSAEFLMVFTDELELFDAEAR